MREALGCGSCEGLVFKDRIPVTQNHACIQCSLFPRQASRMVKFFTSRKCNYPAHLKRYVASSCDHKSRTVSCCCWYVCRPPPWRDGTLTDSIVMARSCAHLFNCGKYGQGDTLMNEISLTLYSLHMLLFHQPVFIFSNDNKKMKNIIFQYCDSQNNKIHGLPSGCPHTNTYLRCLYLYYLCTLCIYIYTYMYVCVYIHMYVYVWCVYVTIHRSMLSPIFH